ncbi:CD209 antigen-like protein C [Scleropages formosus]|uniref:CD209 antigen-like protein C n=1 Tax=Scleropages formosus TaxID=113540 RepID=UPI0010FAC993|nr:CD209 antigen-like protein C [Scleropages formosus]
MVADRDQLQIHYNTAVRERDQLQTRYNTAVRERDQLQANNSVLTREKNQLETSYRNCSVSKEQLEKQVCPEWWNSFKFNCYYISHEKKNWDDSKRYCTDRGADLVIINSKEEQAFIDHFQGSFWIGLSDKETEGIWKWVDGTIMPQYEGIWCSDQPDNFKRGEDCVETRLMEPEPNKRWNDLPCDNVLRWVCEKKASS